MPNTDGRAEPLLQSLFNRQNIRGLNRTVNTPRSRRHRLLQLLNELLGVTHCQTAFKYTLGNQPLLLGNRQSQNYLRVPDAELAVANPRQHFRRQCQQPERVRHRRATATNFVRNLLLRQFENRRQLFVSACFLHRIQIFALNVFD